MPTKAVSPLIATVLVIGFAIALSGIMMTWGTSFVKDIQERSEKSSLKDIACTKDVGLNIKSATVLGNKIKLVVENLGQMDMDKLNILLVGSDGGDNIVTGSGISAGGIQSFSVALDPNKIGTFKQVEAMPYITFEGEQIACKDAVDKKEDLAIDTDGLIAYYKLDGDAKDSAGNNNGVINGNPATVNGVFGNALNFDGNDHVNLGTNFNQPPRLSISLWFKTSSLIGESAFGQSNVAPPSFPGSFIPVIAVMLTSGLLRGEIWISSVGSITSPVSVADGNWHHAIMVGDSTIQYLYLDGALVGSRSGTIIQNWWTNTQIGAGYESGARGLGSGWRYFNGVIDEVKIYNKAKTY
jgi:hypothetical protein